MNNSKTNGIGILKDQNQLQELKMDIANKGQWMFEMARLNIDRYGKDYSNLSKDLQEILDKEFPTHFETEKNGGSYPKDWDEEKKERSLAEYKQILEISNFCKLALFSRSFDLLDNAMINLNKLEDWESKYGRNFVYSLQNLIRKYTKKMIRLNRQKWIKVGKDEERKRIKSGLMKRIGTKIIWNYNLINLLDEKGDDDDEKSFGFPNREEKCTNCGNFRTDWVILSEYLKDSNYDNTPYCRKCIKDFGFLKLVDEEEDDFEYKKYEKEALKIGKEFLQPFHIDGRYMDFDDEFVKEKFKDFWNEKIHIHKYFEEGPWEDGFENYLDEVWEREYKSMDLR